MPTSASPPLCRSFRRLRGGLVTTIRRQRKQGLHEYNTNQRKETINLTSNEYTHRGGSHRNDSLLRLWLLETAQSHDEGKNPRILPRGVQGQEAERLFEVVIEVNLEPDE